MRINNECLTSEITIKVTGKARKGMSTMGMDIKKYIKKNGKI